MPQPESESTELLLRRWSRGDQSAAEELYARIEEALRRRAHYMLVQAGQPRSLGTASLIHEAWLRLIEPDAGVTVSDRDHFLRLAACAMRSIVVDRARAQGALKRGGAARRVSLADGLASLAPSSDLILDLDGALLRLRTIDERRHQIAELRIFGDLDHEEIGRILGTSARTIDRSWRATRAWLERELELN